MVLAAINDTQTHITHTHTYYIPTASSTMAPSHLKMVPHYVLDIPLLLMSVSVIPARDGGIVNNTACSLPCRVNLTLLGT